MNFEKRDKSLQMIVLQPHEYVFIAPELQHALVNHVNHKNQEYNGSSYLGTPKISLKMAVA